MRQTIYYSIEFPDSGWVLRINRQGGKVVFALHWQGKPEPTHIVEEDAIDIKNVLEMLT